MPDSKKQVNQQNCRQRGREGAAVARAKDGKRLSHRERWFLVPIVSGVIDQKSKWLWTSTKTKGGIVKLTKL